MTLRSKSKGLHGILEDAEKRTRDTPRWRRHHEVNKALDRLNGDGNTQSGEAHDLGWVQTIYQLSKNKRKTEQAIDMIIDKMDDLLTEGKFENCDTILNTLDIEALDDVLLVCFLSSTVCGKDKLQKRVPFAQKVKKELTNRALKRVENLMVGLE